MEASFPSFTLHPFMKLFPSHMREGTNCGTMFSLIRATQDFCLEGLCWAQESCLTSPEKAGGECSVKRADSLNSGRFFLSLNSSMKFNCLSGYLCSFMIKYIYIFSFNPRLPRRQAASHRGGTKSRTKIRVYLYKHTFTDIIHAEENPLFESEQ